GVPTGMCASKNASSGLRSHQPFDALPLSVSFQPIGPKPRRIFNCLAFLLTAALGTTGIFVTSSAAIGQSTTRVSVASDGSQGTGFSSGVHTNAGRFVTFVSGASNLVPGDTNGTTDLFLHDRQTGATVRVSVASDGSQISGPGGCCYKYAVSAGGRIIAFSGEMTNLVPGDTNGQSDVFVHDRQAGETTRISNSPTGTPGNGASGFYGVDVSSDGRYVSFDSDANNLVPGDTNGGGMSGRDIFVRDLQTGQTSRVNVSSSGTQSSGQSNGGRLSGDGRYVVFFAQSLIGTDQAYIRDRQTGQTSVVSLSSSGTPGNGWS